MSTKPKHAGGKNLPVKRNFAIGDRTNRRYKLQNKMNLKKRLKLNAQLEEVYEKYDNSNYMIQLHNSKISDLLPFGHKTILIN